MPTPPGPKAGWCPFATPHPVPGYWDETQTLPPVAHVMHIAQCSVDVCTETFDAGGKSAHGIVSRTGDIIQYVNLFHSAWGNGASRLASGRWMDPEGSLIAPTFWYMRDHPDNPNRYTKSLEHEGYASEAWTTAMVDATVAWLRWANDTLMARYSADIGIAYLDPHVTLAGHYEFSPRNRPNCPGPYCDFATLAQRGNERPAAHGNYKIVAAPGSHANIRQGPGTQYQIAGQFDPGTIFQATQGNIGEVVAGSRLWIKTADGRGWVHNSLTDMVS